MSYTTFQTDHPKFEDIQLSNGNQEVRWKYIDGKATTTMWTPPYDVKIVGGYVVLAEVPDASSKTYTVKLTDGTNDISDTKTFTEGTDSAGDGVFFKIDDTYYELSAGDTLKIVTAGTTTTKGECQVVVFIERQL